MSVIKIFNSGNKNQQIFIQAEPKTEQSFDWKPFQTKTYYDFNYNDVKNGLIKNGTHIGSKPDYFSLENYNRIRFEEKDKAFKVYDIHITLYKENEVINEPSILVISFYANNNVKKLYEKLQRKYCKYK